MKIKLLSMFLLAFSVVFLANFFSCSGGDKKSESSDSQKQEVSEAPKAEATSDNPLDNKGVGPVTSVEIKETIDKAMAKKGQATFESICSACHKFDSKLIGPALAGITKIRAPEWIMNMVLNPEVMIQKDKIARDLYREFNRVQMTNAHLTQEQARDVLEYLRSVDAETK